MNPCADYADYTVARLYEFLARTPLAARLFTRA